MLSACGITTKSLELLFSCDNNNSNSVHRDVAISADIKTTPDDFVVVEVDTDGQRTDDTTRYTFTKETKTNTDVKPTNNKVAKTGKQYEEEESTHNIAERQSDIENSIKTIVDADKTEIECALGSTSNILQKANAMTLHEVQELWQEIMPHSQSTYALNNDNNNKNINNSIIVGSSSKWWNKTTSFTFSLEDINCINNDTNCSTNENSNNTKRNKETRRMFYSIMRERFPLLRTHLIESTKSNDDVNNNNSSSTLESVAELECELDKKEELASEECREENNIAKQSEATGKVCVTVDLHLIFVAWLCGQEVALWLSSCIHTFSLQSSGRDKVDVVDGNYIEQVKRANTINFTFKDVDHENTTANCSCENEQCNNITLTSKEVRRNFHILLRRYYSYTKCKVRNGRVELQFSASPQSRKRCRNNSLSESNATLCKDNQLNEQVHCQNVQKVNRYAYLIVKKENMETAEMKMVLAAYFGIHEHYICTAGLKDKVAITYQRCSIPLHVKLCKNNNMYTNWNNYTNNYDNSTNNSVEDTLTHIVKGSLPFTIPLESTPSTTSSSGKKCEIVKCSFPSGVYTSPIEIGDLNGNYFKIVLRNVEMHQRDDSATATICKCSNTIVNCPDDVSDNNNKESKVDKTKSILTERARYLTLHGFINYFGQQRFSESVNEVHDHTGVLLLAEDYVNAVKSLFRSCPQVYMQFPETMDKRHVPQHARDAQVMAHALRQTYKMFFSEFDLTEHDVQDESKLWQAICHKAITEATPFALRTMWVHAAQSLLFNLQASFVTAYLTEHEHENSDKLMQTMASLKLRIPGFDNHINTITSTPTNCQKCELKPNEEELQEEHQTKYVESDLENTEAFTEIQQKALSYALQQVKLDESRVFTKRKVVNVPFHAGWRHFLALPRDVQLSVTTACNLQNVSVSMYLPSSTYATIFLRELLNYDK